MNLRSFSSATILVGYIGPMNIRIGWRHAGPAGSIANIHPGLSIGVFYPDRDPPSCTSV
jgi:hypothetical protein